MEAEDGSVAIETLRANDFDLLFLDLNMPGANGVDVLAFYRVQKNSANPVFVVTVDIPEGLPATLTKMGGCYIIERPITQESVRKAMVTCVTAKNAPCADSASVLHAQPRHVLSRTRFALFLGLSVASVVALVALIATG
jgi:DNA-binding response OmpR family regulator